MREVYPIVWTLEAMALRAAPMPTPEFQAELRQAGPRAGKAQQFRDVQLLLDRPRQPSRRPADLGKHLHHIRIRAQEGHAHAHKEGDDERPRLVHRFPVETDGSALFRIPANTPIAATRNTNGTR